MNTTMASATAPANVNNAEGFHPAIRNIRAQMTATVVPYGICVSKWSIWSHADPMDARIVVSEIGETWSPYNPPPMIAAVTNGSDTPKEIAIGSPIGIKIAMVPHDVPVARDMIAPIMNKRKGNNAGFSSPLEICIR